MKIKFLFVLLCVLATFFQFFNCILISTVKSTMFAGSASGACELPSADYRFLNPLALGEIPELGELRWDPNFCGHIVEVNCGHGPLNIIVTDLNVGGGLDLYTSSWKKVTKSMPPGVTYCSIMLSKLSAFKSKGNFLFTSYSASILI